MTDTKEPVVTREHREAAAFAVRPDWSRSDVLEQPTLGVLQRVAQLLAAREAIAEQREEARGYERGLKDGSEPWERLAEAEQDDPALNRRLLFTRRDAAIPCGIHASTTKREGAWGHGRNWTAAARSLCEKLGLLPTTTKTESEGKAT